MNESPMPRDRGQEKPCVDVRSFPPEYATTLGKNIYYADHEPEDSHLGKNARMVARGFWDLVAQCETGTPQWLYLMEIGMAAGVLAPGIGTRQETREQSLRAVQHEWELGCRQVAAHERWVRLLRGGLQLLLLGGFVFTVTRLIAPWFLGSSEMQGHSGIRDLNLASLATTFGVCLVGSFVKETLTNRSLRRLGERRDQGQFRAHREYAKTASEEYAACALQAETAWSALTKEPPGMTTRAFNNFIQGLLARDGHAMDAHPRKPHLVVRAYRRTWHFVGQQVRKRGSAGTTTDDMNFRDFE